MLLDDFYGIDKKEFLPGLVKATVSLNPDHRIFAGHFPEIPVVPGVCMVQIVKEIMEVAHGKTYRMVEADNIKFLSIVDPRKNSTLEVSIQYADSESKISLNATLFAGSLIFFKLKATLLPED